MRSNSIRLIAAIVVFLLSLQSAFASADEAKKVFDSLFAPKIKAVSATIDRGDDIALGKEMLAIAKTSEGQPDLLALLCDQVHDLCIKHADGFAIAVESQQFLADNVETKRAGAQEKLTTLLTRQMTAGKADERESAGESLIALLISMGDEKFEKKQYAEAAGDYRRAVTVATQRKAASLEEAKAKLEFAAARDRAVKNLARLQEKLLKDANDFATAEEIVKLYVIELDDPAGAVPYLNRVKDTALKENTKLASASVSTFDGTSSRKLADWYRSLAERSDRRSKIAMLRRAKTLYDRCLELETNEGSSRSAVELLSNAVMNDLKKIEAAGDIVAVTPTPKNIYLGSLEASNVKTIDNVPYNNQGHFFVNGMKHEIVANRKRSLNGIALHPPPEGKSRTTFTIADSYSQLEGGVAINDSSPGATSALVFMIVGDGREIWRSQALKNTGTIESFRVSVKGVKEIQLLVECPGTNEWAFAVWIEPKLTRK